MGRSEAVASRPFPGITRVVIYRVSVYPPRRKDTK